MADDSGDNASNGLDANELFSNLLGDATTAYTANQQATSAIAAAQQPVFATSPLAVFGNVQPQTWLLIGAGVLVMALILRR